MSVAPGHAASNWSEEEERAGRLLNDEFAKMLDIQRQAGAATDTKAGIVAAAALTGAQFLAGQKANVALVVATFVALAAAAGLAYASLRIRGFSEVPKPAPFYVKYKDSHPAQMLYQLAAAKRDAYQRNQPVYHHKARLQNGSVLALAVAAAVGAAARAAGG